MSISEARQELAAGRFTGGELEEQVELARRTTFGVGGPARFLVRCADDDRLARALAFARTRGLPVFVLGGGSNLLVADRGFPGLVIQPTAQQLEVRPQGDEVRLTAAAGVPWDAVVRAAIDAGGAGLEALSGIPGHAGAAPIQNIGAYGHELAERLEGVEALDREKLEKRSFAAEECGFAYRTSHFKTLWAGRYLITRLHFRLPRQKEAAAAYAELRRHLGLEPGERAPLETLRRAVLELRRSKSMLADPGDENGRSAGSFFLNPVVPAEQADELARRCRERGVARDLPRWPAPAGVKLSAAWLIEEAGFGRGHGAGPVGLSSRHCLAIVNRGGATAAQILDFARDIRAGVVSAFGITLKPEPILLGFDPSETL